MIARATLPQLGGAHQSPTTWIWVVSGGPPGSPIKYVDPETTDTIVLSTEIIDQLSAEQQAYFTGKTWASYALFWADVSVQSWFNVSTMGALDKGVAFYDPSSNQHELNRGLAWFGLPIIGGWWDLEYFTEAAWLTY